MLDIVSWHYQRNWILWIYKKQALRVLKSRTSICSLATEDNIVPKGRNFACCRYKPVADNIFVYFSGLIVIDGFQVRKCQISRDCLFKVTHMIETLCSLCSRWMSQTPYIGRILFTKVLAFERHPRDSIFVEMIFFEPFLGPLMAGLRSIARNRHPA